MINFLKNNFLYPLLEFIHDSRAIGIILLSCTAISLVLANVPFYENYVHLWHINFLQPATTHHSLHIGWLHLPGNTLAWINDFFMAFFFLLAGMEIKRELLLGELSSFKKAVLPVGAAFGGMIAPAIIFTIINLNTGFVKGWAIPTATDIAFSLGVASLLGKRVPVSLKIFLTALAIIDDLLAIVVIALFYGTGISWFYLLLAILLLGVLFIINHKLKSFGIVAIIISLAVWYGVYNSGIHASVAGVLIAFCVPKYLLEKLELKLHAIVHFVIMPFFALANTAIPISYASIDFLTNRMSVGIMLALLLGKPIGIFTTVFILTKYKIAQMPRKINYKQIGGAGVLAGIGFTMSIFIATLAFDGIEIQNAAKLSVIIAAFISIILSLLYFKTLLSKPNEH